MPERPSQNDSTNQQHRTMRSDDDNFDRNTRVSNTERRDGEDDDENRSKDDDDQVCLFCFFFYELELQQEKIHKCLSLLTKFRMHKFSSGTTQWNINRRDEGIPSINLYSPQPHKHSMC